MTITQELLETIYKRANEFATIRYGSEPDKIQLDNEGITAIWENYRCGDYDYEYEYITADNLTEDLDEVARKRQIELEERRKAEEIKRKQEQERREKVEKERRKQDYLKLKKEFENI